MSASPPPSKRQRHSASTSLTTLSPGLTTALGSEQHIINSPSSLSSVPSDGSVHTTMPIASISGLHSSSSSGSVGPALSFHGSSTSPASYSSNGDSTSSHESDSSTYASSENPPWRKLSEYGNFDESEPHIGFINLERFLLVLDAMGNLGVEGYTNYDWVSYAFFRAAQFWDERLLYRNGEVILMRFLGAIPSNCKGITTLERVENAFVETSLECGDQYPVWEGAYYYEEQSSQSDEQ